ncbi:pimeloyl-ACP methyl ester carboxylesterase [Arthrobacter ginsengisoli]|uniref:Pimeloyl-ACP methyl ester carboxylesterase n=1 Tax=Arthrobacter ginsengisoli TaxID=1356565 RepID=A0ABU1U927_9MICC|nr:alpha/beta hydrolase [Arthrobacter ginsengisoli]MDR7081693.1 pimeloyl-ACP methyl ester carboxylesterase [Arthrobacter ginsengisoli]
MDTRTISTDDGEGHLVLHSFRPAAGPGLAAGQATGQAPGPGIVVVHGTMITDALYRPFARNVSRLLGRPVHCYNRRGRDGSSPQPAGYSVATEIGDLAAVMRETGSSDVVAHSYGGFVALQAALTLPIRRMVTYDAAVSLSGNLTHRWRPELERSVAAGQLDDAWAHLVQGIEVGGPVSKLPLGALRMLSILSARTNMGAEMRNLLPTAVSEMRAVLDADAELDTFAAVTIPVLMLSGAWSPQYFTETGRQLAAAVPSIEFAVLPGQLHESPLRPGIRLPRAAARFLLAGEGSLRPLPARRRRLKLGR